MSRKLVVEAPGSFKIIKVDHYACGDEEVIVQHHAVGVNSYDMRQCRGDFNIKTPFVPGCEAAGEIVECGKKVRGLAVGDRVIYSTHSSGAYAEISMVQHDYLIKIPVGVSYEVAVSVLHKAMTAHSLLRRTFFVDKVHTILIQNAAVGVGYFLTVLAKHYGCKVIATVGNQVEAQYLLGKVDCILNYNTDDVPLKVREFTGDKMVHVAYDSLGQVTLDQSLNSLMALGLFVGYDATSGVIKALDSAKLSRHCPFVTFPNIFLYKSSRQELALSVNEIFALLKKKVIGADIAKTIKLEDVEGLYAKYGKEYLPGQMVIAPK